MGYIQKTEREIRDAYVFLREKNMTIPSETLQFMLDASLEKLNQVKNNVVLGDVVPCGDCSTKNAPCRSINCQYDKRHDA